MKIVEIDDSEIKYPKHPKVKDLLDNEEPYIAELKAMKDKRLGQMLNTVQIQMGWAVEQQKWVEYEVLKIFREMIFIARMLREEENPDSKEYDEPVRKPKKKKEKKISKEEYQDTEEQIIEETPEADDMNDIQKNNSEQLTLFDF